MENKKLLIVIPTSLEMVFVSVVSVVFSVDDSVGVVASAFSVGTLLYNFQLKTWNRRKKLIFQKKWKIMIMFLYFSCKNKPQDLWTTIDYWNQFLGKPDW